MLCIRRASGEIRDIRCQTTVRLSEETSWKIDFAFCDIKTESLRFAEAKGVETGDYLRKLKLYRERGPAPLEIWKGRWQKPFLKETVVPAPLIK